MKNRGSARSPGQIRLIRQHHDPQFPLPLPREPLLAAGRTPRRRKGVFTPLSAPQALVQRRPTSALHKQRPFVIAGAVGLLELDARFISPCPTLMFCCLCSSSPLLPFHWPLPLPSLLPSKGTLALGRSGSRKPDPIDMSTMSRRRSLRSKETRTPTYTKIRMDLRRVSR